MVLKMFNGKTVLVAGGTGMIGRSLVKMLLDLGAKVVVSSIDPVERCPNGAHFYKCDFRNRNEVKKLFKKYHPNYVFNLLGVKGSPKVVMENPSKFFTPQIQFTINLMDIAMEYDVDWYLYTSSIGVYPKSEIYYEDDCWKDFVSRDDWFGGWAKRMGEVQVEAYNREGKLNTSIIRPANVFGPYDNFDVNNAMVIPSLIRKINTDGEVVVWGDGSAVRDFVYTDDVARAMIFLVENKITEPINIASGKGITIKELVETILNNSPNKPIITWDTTKPIGDHKRVMNVDRIRSHGFELEWSFDRAIRETISWYLKNIDIVDDRYNVFKE